MVENLVGPRKAFAVLRFIDSLTFQPVTSSPQGPPSYSTHAALHSNQILTLKVCHPLAKANSSFAPPRRGLTSFASLLDGKKGTLSLFQLSPLASTSRGLLMCHLCFSPQQLPLCGLTPAQCQLSLHSWFPSYFSFAFFHFPLCLPTLFLSLPSVRVLCLPLSFAPQMVFPSYNHGFISGDQSNSFQRRFLKVDHNKRHVCLLTTHRHLPSSCKSCLNLSHLLFQSHFCFQLCCTVLALLL